MPDQHTTTAHTPHESPPDVAALVRAGARTTITWQADTPAGYHITVHDETDPVVDVLVAEGRAPDWDEAWQAVHYADLAVAPPEVTDPEHAARHRAAQTLDRAVGDAIHEALRHDGLLDVHADPPRYPPLPGPAPADSAYLRTYAAAERVARQALSTLIEEALRLRLTITDLADARDIRVGGDDPC